MHHMTRKPRTAKPTREPAMPPTTAVVLMDPEELEVAEGVADIVLDEPSVIPLAKPVAIEVLWTVTIDGEV